MTEATTPYVIDLRVKSLDALFNELDPSPFRERDLDPRAAEYIEQWATDAPAKVPLELRVHLPKGTSAATATEAQDAVRHFFKYEWELLMREHKRNRRRAMRWFGVGVVIMTVLLSLDALVEKVRPDTFVSNIVSEALVIAGWVSVWLPIERFGFEGWLLKDRLAVYSRLAQMSVEIVTVD